MDKIVTIDNLNENILSDLLENRVCAIRIPNFCSRFLAKRLGGWFLKNERLEPYDHEVYENDSAKYLYFGVDRVGIPYNKTFCTPPDSSIRKKYYAEALKAVRQVRLVCSPYLSPIDRLRVELDEVWSGGANVASYEGKKMFVGIGRVMKAALSKSSEEQPHFDSLPSTACNLEGQFAANVYLSIPENGGELELWDVPPIPPSVILNSDLARDWRSELPESMLLKPKVGDLVIINTRRPHAIRSFYKGVRISIQCFIGYRRGEPLYMWN